MLLQVSLKPRPPPPRNPKLRYNLETTGKVWTEKMEILLVIWVCYSCRLIEMACNKLNEDGIMKAVVLI